MTFKDHRQALTESKDPPMLLTLRRQGIRNFPNGERVALFSNPQLKIQLAVPYDASTGTLKPSNVLPIKEEAKMKTINNFADWHEAAERKGGQDTSFKVHNAGGATSAYAGSTHLGTYHHGKREGHLFEELLDEAPIHRINTILKTGEEDNVMFGNGAAGRVHPQTAKVVHDLFHKVNSGNKRKLSQLINSSPEGLERVAKFAQDMAAKKAKAEAKK